MDPCPGMIQQGTCEVVGIIFAPAYTDVFHFIVKKGFDEPCFLIRDIHPTGFHRGVIHEQAGCALGKQMILAQETSQENDK
jgi:hypothetical protein